MTEADVRIRLANDYLPKVDTASMLHGLEVRVPLLDEALFAFALTLPAHLKRSPQGESKVVLRALARAEVPAVASLPKHGFGVPVDTWVGQDFKAKLGERLLDRGSALTRFLDPRAFGPVVSAFSTGQQYRGLTRQGLYQRAVMLLALDLALDPTATTRTGAP
jgi:asparagine synthase (glutamine-hydrolysing)